MSPARRCAAPASQSLHSCPRSSARFAASPSTAGRACPRHATRSHETARRPATPVTTSPPRAQSLPGSAAARSSPAACARAARSATCTAPTLSMMARRRLRRALQTPPRLRRLSHCHRVTPCLRSPPAPRRSTSLVWTLRLASSGAARGTMVRFQAGYFDDLATIASPCSAHLANWGQHRRHRRPYERCDHALGIMMRSPGHGRIGSVHQSGAWHGKQSDRVTVDTRTHSTRSADVLEALTRGSELHEAGASAGGASPSPTASPTRGRSLRRNSSQRLEMYGSTSALEPHAWTGVPEAQLRAVRGCTLTHACGVAAPCRPHHPPCQSTDSTRMAHQ